jgi:hypothetical protein
MPLANGGFFAISSLDFRAFDKNKTEDYRGQENPLVRKNKEPSMKLC